RVIESPHPRTNNTEPAEPLGVTGSYRQRPLIARRRIFPAPQPCLDDRQEVQSFEEILPGRTHGMTESFCLGELALVVGVECSPERFGWGDNRTCHSAYLSILAYMRAIMATAIANRLHNSGEGYS